MAGRSSRAVVLAAVLLTVLGGCSWSPEEPGLFSSPTAADPTPGSEASTPASDGGTPATTSGPDRPGLPTLAEAFWTTADGNAVDVRFAVHAVRRSTGATVLDWSVTPLAGPGRRPGELVPSGTDLGLTRALAGEQDLTLVDAGASRAYRPLADVSRARFRRCLCTPLYAITPQLRFDQTRLLQLVFPPLPAGVTRVDLVLPNVAVVPGVPVTPVGTTQAVDTTRELPRPAAPSRPTRPHTFTGPDGRHQTVVIDQVVATRDLTSVLWTLHSVDDQPGLGSSPGAPVSSPSPAGVRLVTENPASGPRLRVPGGGKPVAVRWTTATVVGRPAYECLCSGLGLWSRSLRHGGGSAHLATHLGPVPAGTRTVDVLLPGLPGFTDVPVTRRADLAGRVRTTGPGTDATWTYDEADPPTGWSPQDWPTPLPAPAQLDRYASEPERVLPALPGS